MVKDLTCGKPFSLIIKFAIPVLLGNLFQQLYFLIDAAIVGQFLGVDALGAVGSTDSITFLVIGFTSGICSGFAIPIAQHFGAGDYKNMRKAIINSLILTFIISAFLTVITECLIDNLLVIMKTPKETYDMVAVYIKTILAGLIGTMFYNMTASIMRALGDSRTPLLFLLLSSGLNIMLDLIFIIVFKMAVFGAAFATILAQIIAALACLICLFRKYDVVKPKRDEFKFSLSAAGHLLYIGIPMGLQFSITAIGTIVIQTAANSIGPVAVSSMTAALKIHRVASQPLEALGATMATYSGQNIGAGQLKRLRKGVLQSNIIAIVYSIVACAVVVLFGKYLTYIFIKPTAENIALGVFDNIQSFYNYVGPSYFLLGTLLVLRNSIQGAGYAVPAMLAGVFEMVARSYVGLALVEQLGFIVICIANPFAWVAANVLLVPTYYIIIPLLKKRVAGFKSLKR